MEEAISSRQESLIKDMKYSWSDHSSTKRMSKVRLNGTSIQQFLKKREEENIESELVRSLFVCD